MVEALNLLYSLYTGTQLMIAIIDARSIANAYYYGVTYAQQGLQRMRWSTPCALQSVLQKSAEISVRSIFKKCAISFLKHKNLDKMRKRLWMDETDN